MKKRLKATSMYDRWKADEEIYRQLEIKKYGKELTKVESEERIQKRVQNLTNGQQVKEYKKKPIIIKAIQWNGYNYEEIEKFTNGNSYMFINSIQRPHGTQPTDRNLFIRTLEGTMRSNIGDYIIQGIQGEFYSCKESIFLETYEIIDNGTN